MIQTNKFLYLLYGLFCSQSSQGIVSADIGHWPKRIIGSKTFWILTFKFLFFSFCCKINSLVELLRVSDCSTAAMFRQSPDRCCSGHCSNSDCRGEQLLFGRRDEQWVEFTKNILMMTWFKSLDCYREALVLNRFCPLCRINKNALCTLRRIN